MWWDKSPRDLDARPAAEARCRLLRSYGAVAVAGGLVPGMGASELTNLTADHTWVPQVGWQRGLPLLVILGVMLLLGHPLPEGGHCWRPGFPQRCAPRTRRRWRCCWHRGPSWCS